MTTLEILMMFKMMGVLFVGTGIIRMLMGAFDNGVIMIIAGMLGLFVFPMWLQGEAVEEERQRAIVIARQTKVASAYEDFEAMTNGAAHLIRSQKTGAWFDSSFVQGGVSVKTPQGKIIISCPMDGAIEATETGSRLILTGPTGQANIDITPPAEWAGDGVVRAKEAVKTVALSLCYDKNTE